MVKDRVWPLKRFEWSAQDQVTAIETLSEVDDPRADAFVMKFYLTRTTSISYSQGDYSNNTDATPEGGYSGVEIGWSNLSGDLKHHQELGALSEKLGQRIEKAQLTVLKRIRNSNPDLSE